MVIIVKNNGEIKTPYKALKQVNKGLGRYCKELYSWVQMVQWVKEVKRLF